MSLEEESAAAGSEVHDELQRRTPPPAEAAQAAFEQADRGIPPVNRVRSVQSRVSSALAFTLMAALGGGFLVWYYHGQATRPRSAAAAAQDSAKQKASGEMKVPPLGAYALPKVITPAPASAVSAPAANAPPSDPIPLAEKLLGEPPAFEPARFERPASSGPGSGVPSSNPGTANLYGGSAAAPRNPWEAMRERQLAGPAFAHSASEGGTSMPSVASEALPGPGSAETGGPLGALLHPTATPAAQAKVLPTRELLLPKGSFLDCTLETALDSSLPGLATCLMATDVFSADGRVVLLERGTKLVGETRGESRRGTNRLFVLWTEARTPTGVVVELASPGTDALGRAGLEGTVARHFWERFGAAILISVIDGAIEAGAQAARSGNSGTVLVEPSGSQSVMSEALKETVGIPPTLAVPQGSRIQILVARDLDFRSVYELDAHTAAP